MPDGLFALNGVVRILQQTGDMLCRIAPFVEEGTAKLPETAVIREILRSVAQTRSAISQFCSESILEVRLLHRIEFVIKENATQLDRDISPRKPTAHVSRRETPPLFAPTQRKNRLQRSNDGFHATYYTMPAFRPSTGQAPVTRLSRANSPFATQTRSFQYGRGKSDQASGGNDREARATQSASFLFASGRKHGRRPHHATPRG